MSDVFELRMPHFGEGMHYAKVVSILKGIGDSVEEDSNVIIVETDKTSVEVPSPVSGHIADVMCEVGQIINVGAPMISIRRQQEKSPFAAVVQKKSSETGIGSIQPASHGRVVSLPSKQISLIEAMKTSQEQVICANIQTRINWQDLQTLRKNLRGQVRGNTVPSSLNLIAWSVAQAMLKHEKFRAKILRDNNLSISSEAMIGIATSAAEDTLDMSVLSIADTTRFAGIKNLPKGEDKQAGGYHSVSISDMSSFEIITGQPVVVYPAIATMVISAPYWAINERQPSEVSQYSNLTLAFDHRAINGAYAANFLKDIKRGLQDLLKRSPSFFTEEQ